MLAVILYAILQDKGIKLLPLHAVRVLLKS